jgi:hypothetical protein
MMLKSLDAGKKPRRGQRQMGAPISSTLPMKISTWWTFSQRNSSQSKHSPRTRMARLLRQSRRASSKVGIANIAGGKKEAPSEERGSTQVLGGEPCDSDLSKTRRRRTNDFRNRRAKDNVFILIDDRKTLSVFGALEIQRIVIGGVQMSDLERAQTNPNLYR